MTIVLTFLAACTLRLLLGWISDTDKARSEQLKQSHFIARNLVPPPAAPAPSFYS